MGITNLPKPGIKFRATYGPGSFAKKLKRDIKYDDQGLANNLKAIVDVVKKRERVIRTMGGLSRLQLIAARREIGAKSTVTLDDRRKIRKIFEGLGRGAATGANKTAVGGMSVQASDKKSYLTEAQVKRNLKVNTQRDESGLTRKEYKASFAGNVVSTKSIGTSDIDKEIGAGRIGINTGPVGFAANYKNSKLPDNPTLKTPAAGIRPIGL